jgi:hypothetical protein
MELQYSIARKMKSDYCTIPLILYIVGTMQYDCSSRPMSWKLG